MCLTVTHDSLCHNVAMSIRERRRDEVRERIADAAFALFVERGYAAVTVDDVAAASDVTRRTVHRYFTQKSDLAFARVDGSIDLVDLILTAEPTEAPLATDVLAGLRRVVEQWPYSRDEAAAFAAFTAGSEELRGRDLAKRAAVRDRLHAVLVQRRPDDDDADRRTWAALAVELFFLAFDAWLRDGGSLTEHLEQVLRSVERGLAAS
jgi:AcrR family transcriptional regulator